MKKFIFCWLTLLISIYCQAQTFNAADHVGEEIAFNIVTINSRSFYLVAQTEVPSCCTSSLQLTGRLSNGAVAFRKTVFTAPHVNNAQIAVSADKHLLFYGGA